FRAVLELPCARTVAGQAARLGQRVEQVLVQRQSLHVLRAHFHQALAEFLGGMRVALALALARRPTGAVIVEMFHDVQLSLMSQTVDVSRIPDLADTVALALAEARAAGATQAEADVSLQQGLSVTVRLGEVETVEYQRDRGLGITVYFDGAKGSASSADLRPAAVRDMVAKACSIARHTARDEYAGLADAADMARDVPDLDLYHPWDISPEQAIELARECEAAGRAVDRRLANSEGASVGTHRGVRVYGNSHGF